MSRQLISYDDLAPVSSASSSGAEAGPSSMKLSSAKVRLNDPATSSPASASGTEKMTYSQRKRIKRKKKQDARSRELNHQSKKSPQANKKAKYNHHEAQSSVEADSMMQATTSSDVEQAIYEAADGTKDQAEAEEAEPGENYDEYGYYDDNGHYYYDEEGNSFYFDPHAQDEDDAEDAMTMLNTNIMIPDIPKHLKSAVNGDDYQQSSEMESYEEELDDDDGERGRVLEPEEIWSEDALTLAWTAARETLLHTSGLSIASTHSALWSEAPTPGSVAARKAKRESEMNLERRKLLAWQEEKRRKEEAARRAEDEEDQARNEAVSVAAPVQTNGSNPQQGSMASVAVPASDGSTTVSRASPVKSRLGGRSIPPSIGLPGNQAWRDACKTVAATRNQVGPEVVPQASSTAKVNGQPQETPIPAAGATAVAPPPIAGSTFPPPAPAATPNSIPSTGNPQQDQILQNIANAWYCAGYYTAQWHWMTSAGGQQ